MAATRYHVAGTTVAAVTVAKDSNWEDESGAMAARAMSVAGFNEARAASGFLSFNNVTASGGTTDAVIFQFVSDAIAPGPIAGTLKGQIQALENNAANDLRIQMIVRVVSNDGSTVRGTLYGPDTAALSSEFSTTIQNRNAPRGGSVSLSPVSAQLNDRIVIEVGFRSHAASGSVRGQLVAGGLTADSDLPEDETTASTSGVKPWFEFSADLYTSRLRGARAYILD